MWIISKLFYGIRSQNGDTFVEVLIATAIAGLVLTVSYATVNHSTNMTQDAQEHSEALKLAQTQVEFLRAKGAPGNTCFSSLGVPTGAGACIVNAGGLPAVPGKVAFTQSISGPTADGTYAVTVKWATAIVGSNASIHIYYRIAR